MKITRKWLKEKNACNSGMIWYEKQNTEDLRELFKLAKKDNVLNYINWAVTRKMTKPQCVEYAIFAAEQVIEIYEKKYPKDDRPRKAIEAAKKYLKSPTESNKKAAYAADAADAAAYAAYAADAADAAAYAADAAYAAAVAADAADAAAYAADAAAVAAAARKKLQVLIIKNGIKILEQK